MKNDRPIPLPDDATEAYWAAARAHRFEMQCCAACDSLRFPPRPMCPHCQSFESRWVEMSGRGRVYSWVVCHPPVLPAFSEGAPYAVILVELEEDPLLRVVGNLFDVAVADIHIGLEVEVVFEDVSDEVSLPQWRPSGDGGVGPVASGGT